MTVSRLLLLTCLIHANPVLADATSQAAMTFQPILHSAYGHENDPDIDTAPFLLPEGYQQRIVASERTLNLYVGADMLDMNTVNETGPQAGRYLYRTHEVRSGNSHRTDGGKGGAVSVIDLKTGITRELIGRPDWEALDGIVWTPWGSLLLTEEIGTRTQRIAEAPDAGSGLVYELRLKPDDPMSVSNLVVRPLLGSLTHEGIQVDAQGHVYVIDENRKGSIYRFVPERYGDLSSGQLYALRVTDGGKTGPAAWVTLDMRQVVQRARVSARAQHATEYCRPEDIDIIRQTLYVALTCEDVDNAANSDGAGAILAVQLGESPYVRYVVAPGKNAPVEVKPGRNTNGKPTAGVSGFAHPDNLAHSADGRLWIVEDNEWSDIWVFDPDSPDANGDGYPDGMSLFASLKDKSGEGSGLYFSKDPGIAFVNVQHSGTGNDKTVAISPRPH